MCKEPHFGGMCKEPQNRAVLLMVLTSDHHIQDVLKETRSMSPRGTGTLPIEHKESVLHHRGENAGSEEGRELQSYSSCDESNSGV